MECRKKKIKLTEEITELEKKSKEKIDKIKDIKEIFIHGRIISRDVKEDEKKTINMLKTRIFGDSKDDIINYIDANYYNTIKIGINCNFLERNDYAKNLDKKKLLNKMRKLELEINKNNTVISSDDFQSKKSQSLNNDDYKNIVKREFEEKKNNITNENKEEIQNLEYIISLYEGELALINLEEQKIKILKTNIKEIEDLRYEKDSKLKKMTELYNNSVDMCKSKCNIKNDLNIKKMGVILGTDYLTKKNLNKEFINKLLNKKKCCRKELINIDDILKNHCNSIEGGSCDVKYLLDKKKMIEDLNKTYDNEIKSYLLVKLKLNEDTENNLVKTKINIMTDFKKKQVDEIYKYKDVILKTNDSLVLDCKSESNSENDILLCNLKEKLSNKLNTLKEKYKEYLKKYGCIDKTVIKSDKIHKKYMKKCLKNLKEETKNKKDKLKKVIEELEKKNKHTNYLLNKINKQIDSLEYKKQNFVCNKSLALYGKTVLNIFEDLYKKCLC